MLKKSLNKRKDAILFLSNWNFLLTFCDVVFYTEHEEREGMESIAKSLDFGGVTHYHEGEESDGASSSKGQWL